MTAVMLAEWTKLRTIRSTVWTLALTFLISVGLAAASGFSVRNAYESGNAAMVRPDFDPVYSGFVGLLYGQLALITFGALLVTSEFGTGTMRATLAAVPRRGLAYGSKLLVGCGAALVVAVATVLVSWPVNQAGLGPYGTSMAAPGVPRALAGAAVYLTLIYLFSAGVAAILRSTALTLGILIPLFFIVGPVLSRIPGVSAVARYLPDQAGQRLMDTEDPLPALLALIAWTAAAVGAGYASVRSRDV
ncbi:ABC transporter permease [Dactylosporangium sp. AC04546]|uniref:ABC transporter permease n=1 Tax=Dactylosporangium sp. AC04546 TaxID=2862460 RepID=UPI001EDE3B28|nr:ABC transporter permease [Dactylosporangium sp. AC04546]WVK79124.1 ABC transporter permease [Dactylosporangium sp. AC04546]